MEIVVTKCPSVRSLATNAYDIILQVNQDWANDRRLDLLVFDEHLLLFLFMGQYQRLGAIYLNSIDCDVLRVIAKIAFQYQLPRCPAFEHQVSMWSWSRSLFVVK